MNFSASNDTHAEVALSRVGTNAVLAREAGMPFQPQPTINTSTSAGSAVLFVYEVDASIWLGSPVLNPFK